VRRRSDAASRDVRRPDRTPPPVVTTRPPLLRLTADGSPGQAVKRGDDEVLKHWERSWTIALVEKLNPDRDDLSLRLL